MADSLDWRPTAPLEVLRQAAEARRRIRRFFEERGVLEVDTPALSAAGLTDPYIDSFTTCYTGPSSPHGGTLYLHTSPEFPMKRLLAAGSGPIYQMAKVFRQGEAGRLHNPEFTLLEWYRPGWDHLQLMAEVEELVRAVLGEKAGTLGPTERLTYREAFLRHARVDPFTASTSSVRATLQTSGAEAIPGLDDADRGGWLDAVLTHRVEPHLGLGRLTFLHDYPAHQAALARLRPAEDGHPVAERFELYWQGIELANGFHELAHGDEQRRRFEHDLELRRQRCLEAVAIDERLIAALEHGLPACSGVALGVDRLVMLAVGAAALADVLAFPIDRA